MECSECGVDNGGHKTTCSIIKKRELASKGDSICEKCGNIQNFKRSCTQCGSFEIKPPSAKNLKFCKSCKAEIAKSANQCPKCNEYEKEICKTCNEYILPNSTTCPQCGELKPFKKSSKKTIVWIMLLAALSILYGSGIDFIMSGHTSFASKLGAGIGGGGPIFIFSGIIPLILYLTTKNSTRAMWVWTILLLLTFAALSMGGMYGMKHSQGF